MASKNGASLLKEVITLSDVATLTVQSERSVQRLVKSGIFKLAKDRQGRQLKGRYILGQALPAFCEHLRDSITSDDPNERAYVEARARRMQASAESAEMDLRLKRGELLEREHIMFVMSNLLVATKNHLLSIPSRVMHQLVGKTDPREINLLVRGEVERALREVSEFDVKQLVRKKIAAHRDRDDAVDRNGEEKEERVGRRRRS